MGDITGKPAGEACDIRDFGEAPYRSVLSCPGWMDAMPIVIMADPQSVRLSESVSCYRGGLCY